MALTVVVAGLPPQRGAEAADAGGADLGQYLGRWNYDLPDRADMTNIAVMNLPNGGLQAPQIGDIVFTLGDDGGIIGRTDVGCTWRFKAASRRLELDPPAQLCHNPTLHVSYTITRWTVSVDGKRERETVIAKSHHPDRDYDFVLDKGARTKANDDPNAARPFLGTWTYDPSDPQSRINIRTTQYTAPDGAPRMIESPQQGQVTITRDYANRITVRTDEGCTWTLLARGSTAKLDPPVQTCMLPSLAAITLTYYTIVTDGRRQAAMMVGTDERGGTFVLSSGVLTKR
ncbi:hypothetical protein ACNAW0_01840 [Micromonospora sp. SL1-18]|uniref:hypothetical protein n=1 Tax=Micromonospora sp. SL1-18 TaxID=3399128 RepID=UPI003A4D3015